MSLFKLKELWNARPSNGEEFDSKGICLAYDVSNRPFIVTGSFQGILRIYNPTLLPFTNEDLLMEKNMKSSILSVSFINNAIKDQNLLAVLLSKKLIYFELCYENKAIRLDPIGEIATQRTSFLFISGKFGQNPRTWICILSVDGLLQFYEGMSFQFSIQLPDFILPGPICYIPSNELLVVYNKGFEIEAYSFKSMVNICTKHDIQDNEKKLFPEWSFVIGEMPLEIKCLYSEVSKNYEVVALGESTLFCFNELGVCIYQRRLTYLPTCFDIYQYQEDKSDKSLKKNEFYWNSLIGVSSGHIMIYCGTILAWAASISYPPILVQRVNIRDNNGLIMTFSDEGSISVSILGTDKDEHIIKVPEITNEGIEKIGEKLSTLNRQIALAESGKDDGDKVEQIYLTVEKISEVLETQDAIEEVEDYALAENGKLWCCIIDITITFSTEAQNVKLKLNIPNGIYTEKDLIQYDEAITQRQERLVFYASKSIIPSTLEINIVTCFSIVDDSRVETNKIVLPFSFFCFPAPIENMKSAEYKVTIGTNKSPIQVFD